MPLSRSTLTLCICGFTSLRWSSRVARSGHEPPVYPSYYPHEIDIAMVAPERAAELLAGQDARLCRQPRLPALRHDARGVAWGFRRLSSTRIAARQGRSVGLRHRRRCGARHGRQGEFHRPPLSGDALARRLSPSCRPCRGGADRVLGCTPLALASGEGRRARRSFPSRMAERRLGLGCAVETASVEELVAARPSR